MIKLSLIICTYDRVELLKDCISSILRSISTVESNTCEVIVVSNHVGSHDQLVNELTPFEEVRIVYESTPGLSMARNTGILKANGLWIGFLDDDAIIPEAFIGRALGVIDNQPFDCFGGGIDSWWKYPKPRWMSDTYGSKPPLRDDVGGLNVDQYNWGSNIFIRSEAINQIGGFPTYIGMKGKHIGYAAENIVQDNLRDHGFQIGYDPQLSIQHLVGQQKLSLSWQIKAAYATARDGYSIFPDDYTFQGISKTIRRIIAAPIKGLFRLTEPEYFWENWLLDTCSPWAQLFGKVRAHLKPRPNYRSS